MAAQVGGEFSIADLGRAVGKARKKAAEMGRFFASEYLREPQAQEFWVNKALKNSKPLLTEVGKKGMDRVSTAIRPKNNYLTNRKDLDGDGLLSNMVYGFNYSPWTNPSRKGKGVDIHKAIGKLLKTKSG